MRKKKFLMKKVKALLFAMLLGAPMTATAQNVVINETNFPDENFRNWLLEQDYGRNGMITEEEIKRITNILVPGENISSLKGIEHFTALTWLNCDRNQLTALDVSKNTALTYLTCSSNQITALDVSKNTALEGLSCYDNQLTALDVSKNTALTELNCSGNQLTALDVSKNIALTELDCYNNQLTALDVSKNTVLTELDCYNNQITALDVSKNTVLTRLNCYNNQITALDVSKNTVLTRLNCYNNQITALDVSNNTALTELTCYNNQLTALDVSKNTALPKLDCYNNQLTALDVSNNTALTELNCSGNQLTALDVSKNTALEFINCSSNQIKDESMDALIGSLPQSQASKAWFIVYYNPRSEGKESNICTKAQVAAAKAKGWTVCLNIYSIEYIPDIDDYERIWLDYEGYYEVAINETNFPDENFRNYLLGLEYGADGILTDAEIMCISSISVDNMNIGSLKGIEYFTMLNELQCADNQLAALDVTSNTILYELYCAGNQIKGAEMDALISSLPQESRYNRSKLYVYDNSKSGEGNICTKAQVAAAKDKNWVVYYYDSTKQKWLEYEGSDEKPEGLDIDETNFPDENFRSYLLNQEYGADEVLTDEEIEGIVSLSVDGKGIASLKGIEYFTALTELHCADNLLTAIDLSGNTALTALYCSGNQLTALDVTGNAALTTLDCSDNQIADLDVTGNAVLAMLYCDYNQMAALNVSGCTALAELSCGNNRLTTLTTEGCTALTMLKCANNLLAALDVTGCEALTSINCSRNQIEGESMDALIASLPEVDGGVMNVYDNTKSDEGNVCYKPQVAAAGAKGWVLNWNNNGVWEAYEGTDDPTGISRPTKGTGNAPVYTLSGQKVTGSMKGKKGVYIVGGKKVVVK